MPTKANNNVIQFKAETYPIKYNTRRTAPMPEQYYDNDLFLMQANVEKKAQKKAKSQERWNKAGVIAQMGIAAGIIGSVLLSIFALKKGGASAAENELKELTSVKLKWIDKAIDKSVADLNSQTTSSALKKVLYNIINGSSNNFTQAGKKWGGAKEGINIIYLYGHGGTGKTYVAEQYAQEIGAMFTSIKYPDIGSPFKDGASMKINNFFEELIKSSEKYKDRKIVACIDEIDALMKVVDDAAHGGEEASKSRAALITGLDKIRKKCPNITVIATSNYHPKSGLIDPIALRRFNNQVEVPLPDATQAKALLEMYMKDIGAFTDTNFINTTQAKHFVNKLVDKGYSNGEISLIAEEAGKIFRGTLKGVADSDLKKHPFKIDYLEEALKLKGEASSTTNRLMNVASPQTFVPQNIDKHNSLWQRFVNFFKEFKS